MSSSAYRGADPAVDAGRAPPLVGDHLVHPCIRAVVTLRDDRVLEIRRNGDVTNRSRGSAEPFHLPRPRDPEERGVVLGLRGLEQHAAIGETLHDAMFGE